MLMDKRHPRLVHARPVRRQPEMRQLRLRRERRHRVAPPELGQLLRMLRCLVWWYVMLLMSRRSRNERGEVRMVVLMLMRVVLRVRVRL